MRAFVHKHLADNSLAVSWWDRVCTRRDSEAPTMANDFFFHCQLMALAELLPRKALVSIQPESGYIRRVGISASNILATSNGE